MDTEVYTVHAPIPDFPMPYHVITLVSTALAFLVGSFINIVFRSKENTARVELDGRRDNEQEVRDQ